MILEDDFILGLDLCNLLEDAQFEVTAVARSADEALSMADACRPDVALLDVRLSGNGSGFDVAQKLRERGNLGVVFISGWLDSHLLAQIEEMDRAIFLAKPVHRRDLYAAVQQVSVGRSSTTAL